MPSIVTQNVSAGVASIVQNATPTPPPKEGAAVAQPAQIAQASQVAAAEQTALAKRKDEARSTQIPKRAEGTFAPQTRKGRAQAKDKQESESAPRPQRDGMDIVA